LRRKTTIVVYSTAALIFAATAFRLIAIRSPENTVAATITASQFDNQPLSSHRTGEPLGWPRPLFHTTVVTSDEITGTIKDGGNSSEHRLALIGIVSDLRQRLALIRHGGKIRRVREAETIGSWTVVKINPRTATLRRGTESRELLLDPPLSK